MIDLIDFWCLIFQPFDISTNGYVNITTTKLTYFTEARSQYSINYWHEKYFNVFHGTNFFCIKTTNCYSIQGWFTFVGKMFICRA